MSTTFKSLLQPVWWGHFEIPSWMVLIGNYSAWFLLTWNHAAIPWWLLLFLGGYSICLHGSLQHEFLHGHPTPSSELNKLLIWLPLGLWMPYTIYRDSHIAHHQCGQLTNPAEDPESFYVRAAGWERLPGIVRRILEINNTLAGRLLIGPIIAVAGFWLTQIRMLVAGDRRYAGVWIRHLAGCAAVLYWVVVVCALPWWLYVLLFPWPGLSLTLLRSYTEHRPRESVDQRTIIIEGSWLTRLLFLNNNFHQVHHQEPDLAWYCIGRRYDETRESVLRGNGGFYFKSYLDIARKYLLKSKDSPIYPLA